VRTGVNGGSALLIFALSAEAAGITAGFWYASPATHVAYELIGAGMLILAGDGRGHAAHRALAVKCATAAGC
jgi:hypothetical protein